MKGLVGKRALVTGGSSGIGQAIAVRLGEEGIDVAINYVGRPDGADTNPILAPVAARRRGPVDPAVVYADLPIAAGRPAVRLNMIASLDGAATVDGVSGGLGGPLPHERVGDGSRSRSMCMS